MFRGSPSVLIHVVAPPSALTTPTRADEFVVPAFGYGIFVITGYSESVLLISEKMPTPVLIELPVDDRLAVGAETEAVANAELFLVDPVRGAVDDVLRSVSGQLRDLPVVEPLDVDVVAAHVADARRIG